MEALISHETWSRAAGPEYDVIVAGLGAMGSAAAYHLSKRGKRVLALDRFEPSHILGSSHGLTRIIREAYFEHPIYVPLVQRAYQLWGELGKESGRKLLVEIGGLMIGPREGVLVKGARRSAEEHKLSYEELSAEEVRRRYPALVPGEEMMAIKEPRAGMVFPELAIQTHLELARKNGAGRKFNEPVLRWEENSGGICVFTKDGAYQAEKLIISAGAWVDALVPSLRLPVRVERQILFWFEPASMAEKFLPAKCPIHIWEYEPGRFFYGFPDLGDGIKVAVHHEGETTGPDSIRREVSAEEVERMREILRRFMPAANGKLKFTAVCMYTNAPDEHFILDYHPEDSRVLIVSPCSGHGFKFSPVIGEIAAQMVEGAKPAFDLSLFRLTRFG